jgi:hypothetical protein
MTTEVSRMRGLPFFWGKREWLWYQVNWLDGRRDHSNEDYGPQWCLVTELEQGRFEYDDGLVFDAKPIEGAHRIELWTRYGHP